MFTAAEDALRRRGCHRDAQKTEASTLVTWRTHGPKLAFCQRIIKKEANMIFPELHIPHKSTAFIMRICLISFEKRRKTVGLF